MDELDLKLVDVFSGKVVRKDLLHRIKKGTNVPTFVLEFLLARYCASEEEAEIQAALENFNSQRVAVSEKFFRDNERLLEGGIWAEVTICNNEIEDDDYTFYIEDLRP